jgi:hypothetical protein
MLNRKLRSTDISRQTTKAEKRRPPRLTESPVQSFDTEHPHAHVVIRGVDRRSRAPIGWRRFTSLGRDRKLERRAVEGRVEARSRGRPGGSASPRWLRALRTSKGCGWPSVSRRRRGHWPRAGNAARATSQGDIL